MELAELTLELLHHPLQLPHLLSLTEEEITESLTLRLKDLLVSLESFLVLRKLQCLLAKGLVLRL